MGAMGAMGKRITGMAVCAIVAFLSQGLTANAADGKAVTNSRTGPEVKSASALVVDATTAK